MVNRRTPHVVARGAIVMAQVLSLLIFMIIVFPLYVFNLYSN